MHHFNTIHPEFRLNGISYSKENLGLLAKTLSAKDNYEKAIGQFLEQWLSNTDVVLVQTSGSTGKPKEISLQKEQMVNSALATGTFFGLEESNSALLCLPVDYIAGKMMLVRALILGLRLDYIDPSSNPLKTIDKKYNFCAMIPLQVNESLSKLHLIDTLIIGGAAVSTELKSKLQNSKALVYETYGMTETITHIAVKKINTVDTTFKTLPNVVVSIDKRDCLAITAPKVAAEIIKTNDVVSLISETEFKWLGRHDNIINSGGIKLNPEQIEAKLSNFIKTDFFVASLPDATLENKLVLLIEDVTNINLIEKLKNSSAFTTYEIPKEVYCLPEFIRTKTGKIQRKKTLELLKK